MTGRSMLIGLTGHAGAGKDTVAGLLAGHAWRTTAFADSLRVEVAAAWGIDPRLLTDRATKETPLAALRVGNAYHREWLMHASMQGWSLIEDRSPRWVMQRWGEFRRGQHPDWWVRHVVVWINTHRYRNVPGLVVTDVRMPNEAAALRAAGGHLVRVHRPGAGLQAADTATAPSEGHTALQVDADLHNDGDLHHLHAEVWRVVEALRAQAAALATTQAEPQP